ncbi:MAG: hypothetical protein LC799_33120, partial [Actinobacteria bacterium]|nr:hypothetical protein [Actinomycetota bacterium]
CIVRSSPNRVRWPEPRPLAIPVRFNLPDHGSHLVQRHRDMGVLVGVDPDDDASTTMRRRSG